MSSTPKKLPSFCIKFTNTSASVAANGAISWGIFVDTEAPNTYLESFKVDSWAEHERQHNRFTHADSEAEKQVLSYAIKPVEVQHYIYARERPRFSKADT